MKVLIFTILFLTSTLALAFDCKHSPPSGYGQTLSLAKDAMSIACQATRNEYQCSELETDIATDLKEKLSECKKKPKEEIARCEFEEADKAANDRQRIIQCNPKFIEENSFSNMGLSQCVFDGFLVKFEQLKSLGELSEKIMEGAVKSFREQTACNSSVEKKREILNTYNLTVPDPRFKLSDQFLGRWLEDATCAEIDKQLWARYQNYQDTLMRERKIAIDTGKKPTALKEGEKGSDFVKMIKEAFAAAQVKYECYSPKAKAELMCTAATSLILDLATGYGITGTVVKLATVVRSKKALRAIAATTESGGKVDLKDAGKLLNGDRKKAAGLLLKREITTDQEKALIAAHEVGMKEGRGFFTYTTDDLRKKAKLLKDAGFKSEEIDVLMRNGIAGQFSTQEAQKTITEKIKAAYGRTDPKKAQQMIKDLDSRIAELAKYAKNNPDTLAQATRTKILGEFSQSHDPKVAKGFFQSALAQMKDVVKKPGILKQDRVAANYLDIVASAGDQATVKLAMKEYMAQQKNPQKFAKEYFTQLEDEIQHYRSLGAKGEVALEANLRKRAALAESFSVKESLDYQRKAVAEALDALKKYDLEGGK